MNAIFKTKSLDNNTSDFDLKYGCQTKSFLSFERAIQESLEFCNGKSMDDVKGYQVTDKGIEIIWK